MILASAVENFGPIVFPRSPLGKPADEGLPGPRFFASSKSPVSSRSTLSFFSRTSSSWSRGVAASRGPLNEIISFRSVGCGLLEWWTLVLEWLVSP